jgi:hypothetical protein
MTQPASIQQNCCTFVVDHILSASIPKQKLNHRHVGIVNSNASRIGLMGKGQTWLRGVE